MVVGVIEIRAGGVGGGEGSDRGGATGESTCQMGWLLQQSTFTGC